ncbi:MAG TPA: ThiF family adenylyltransferase [Pirellulaceae bacterium]|nr:ThiF family adenylyltransferase [Pirellulaceae bacterium]HMO94113.1 ThiF family adenylyltransferase [Pirellulaceae bacterium]HMP71040.1 ThiF family adenylyltransferase [Pirellulaceae bacterium]
MNARGDGLNTPEPNLDRYSRQMRYAPIGEQGQIRLASSSLAIVGCGALGSVQASILVRAGVGQVRLIDRDFVEYSNLQRQLLFDEHDADQGLPKAIAAAKKLAIMNSSVHLQAVVEDLNNSNIARLLEGANLILDGTDNFETRFLINDFAISTGTPWVYGGCIGCDGQSMTIVPGKTACLSCLMLDGPPPPGATQTCDTAGILSTIVVTIASFQCNEAIKILTGQLDKINQGLLNVGLWDNQFSLIDLAPLKDVQCPTCKVRNFKWLHGPEVSRSAVLCGRNAVQVAYLGDKQLDLVALSERLQAFGSLRRNAYMLQAKIGNYQFSVFPDGRAIIQGTEDIAKAKSLYAQWIGN